jgi:antitoxin HigA-1
MAIRTEDVAGMDFSDVAGIERIGAVRPGDVLREEFMVPLGLSARALSRELGVPSNRITSILAGDRGVTAETAILLGERFGTSAEFWLNLQVMHELEEARRRMRRAA